MKYGWPYNYQIVQYIFKRKSEFVSPLDLVPAGFLSVASAEAFYYFYQNYDALTVLDEDEEDSMEKISSKIMSAQQKMNRLQWDMWTVAEKISGAGRSSSSQLAMSMSRKNTNINKTL